MNSPSPERARGLSTLPSTQAEERLGEFRARGESHTKVIIFGLLLTSAALSPWGHLLRLGRIEGESALGATTVLAVLIIALGLMSRLTEKGFASYSVALFFLLFLIVGAVASAWASSSDSGLWMAVLLAGYLLLALTVAGLRLDPPKVLLLMAVFAASTALMSLLSLIDYFGLLVLPVINEGSRSVVSLGSGQVITDLSGPFLRRTTLAVYLAMALPIAAGLMMSLEARTRQRLFWSGALIVLTLTVILTFSRMLLISVAAAAAYIAYATWLGSATQPLMRRGAAVGGIVLLSVGLLASFQPQRFEAFAHRTQSLLPATIAANRDDLLRINALTQTWDDLSEAPFGLGFTRVDVAGQRGASVHSNVTMVLRAAGPLGFILVALFALPVFRRSLRICDATEFTLFAALISWAIYGLGHTTIATLFAWVMVGIGFSLVRSQARPHAG